MTSNRDLETITGELHVALKRETVDVITIGDLLIEAKNQLDHGQWLPWLKENFDGGTSTAARYMNAARFAAKFPTVANLKLRPTALSFLGAQLDAPVGLFSTEAHETIFKVAETEWVSEDRCWAIARSLLPPEPEPEPDPDPLQEPKPEPKPKKRAKAKAARSAVNEVLDAPAPKTKPGLMTLAQLRKLRTESDIFDSILGDLLYLQTKGQPADFVLTEYKPDEIRDVARFLEDVATEAEQKQKKSENLFR